MNEPNHTTLRQLRRRAGLTQDDVARILGTGGRSYVAMLESGDRIPHARDVVVLSLLYGTEGTDLFPHLYLTTKSLFQSNVRLVVEEAIKDGEPVDADRVRYLRSALTSVELGGNVDQRAV